MGRVKAIWNGSLELAAVVIPVGLVPTVRDGDPTLKTLHRECSTPVTRPAFCPACDKPVADDDTVKAFEVADGQYVTVEPAELAQTCPDPTRSITLSAIVSPGQIPVATVGGRYWLAPSSAPIGRRPYVLLHALLAEQNLVVVGRLVFKAREWLTVIRPHERLLMLERLVPAEDLVDARDLENLLAGVEISAGEMELGRELVTGKLHRLRLPPGALKTRQRQTVQELIDAKLAGGTFVHRRPRTDAKVMALPSENLTDTLKASLGGGRKSRRPRAASRS